MRMRSRMRFALAALSLFCGLGPFAISPVWAETGQVRITVLYDAFGKASELRKDWGFSALIEYGGKRILFDTGNNAEIFAHNVQAMGVDLTKLDFVVVSHRHGDHSSGLNYLLSVNPGVKVYVPKENFGVFGAALPGTFYKRDESLPAEMRYFDGKPPETMRFGTPWPQGKFTWLTKTTEVAPGFHLIMLKGSWGVDLDVMEISLAIDTPDGTVLVVGCSHPTVERIVQAARAAIDKPVHMLFGGTHLLPATPEQIRRIAASLRDEWKVEWIAPSHCTGEPAFAILRERFGDRYVYAGLGITLLVGVTVTSMAEPGQPQTQELDAADLRGYRALLAHGHDGRDRVLARGDHRWQGPAGDIMANRGFHAVSSRLAVVRAYSRTL